MARVDEVFGVTSKPIRSYVERDEVDTRFRDALVSDKQIVVYGSSKQGKTALVSKHPPYREHLLVSLTPKTTVLDTAVAFALERHCQFHASRRPTRLQTANA